MFHSYTYKATVGAHLWASECPDVKNYKWRLNPLWHRMFYSCIHTARVVICDSFLACRSFAACQKLTYLHGNVEFCQRDRLGDYMIASCFAETRRMVMFYLRMHCIITLAHLLTYVYSQDGMQLKISLNGRWRSMQRRRNVAMSILCW